MWLQQHLSLRPDSFDDDCTLEEEEGLVEEEDEIDQFNDDTFGAGAIDDDWQEEHARLAELDELVRDEVHGAGDDASVDLPLGGSDAHSSAHHPPSSSSRLYPNIDERGGDLAESLTHLILGSDPAIAGVGAASSDRSLRPLMLSGQTPQPSGLAGQSSLLLNYQQQQRVMHRGPAPLSQINSHSIWENSMGFSPVSSGLLTQKEDKTLMSIIKEVGLPNRPPALSREEGRDLSERVPPPRSSSPVIGSPPVRAVPIGTPPKQPMSHVHNQQNNHPPAIHVRASMPMRYPPPFGERLSPNNLRSIALTHPPFPAGVGPVLSQIQRAQLLNSQFQRGPAPTLLQGGVGGFRPFFGQSGPRLGPHGPPLGHVPIRHNTTHLHPQHRRMLNQRMQNRGLGDHVGGRGVGDRRNRDPYSNLMTQREKEWVARIQMMQLQSTDPYLDDYYYQNYYEKMEKRQERDRDTRKEHTTKLITPQVAKLEHTYRPVQFAGSLGKLTVSSVNNPRKMIDAVVTTRTDDEEKREKQVWNKRRQILYTVEKMYSLLLEVQDFEKTFLQTPEHQRDVLLEQHKTHTVQLYNSLREKEWDDRVSDEQCLMIMSVRKGKRLISRLLPFLPQPHAAAVVMGIARNLPALAKKDKQDQVLCWLVEPVTAVIQSLSSTSLTDLLQELQGREGQLPLVLQNKFGVTLLYLILSEGERMQSSDPNCQLMDDNRWTELVFSVTRELLKVPSSALSTPLFTPPNLVSLFSRYVDRQRLELLQEKLQITALTR
ncbi:protein PAT1 homolog 1-like isoform X2 [Carassius carassius]|uniref:protein PAT1 homolog 1-like isoform X2 n=1 Tax=Carassius carassius TaxID=217509 RepID=UPI00286943B0|nr:protein PAT1 homolog 1-like isoform X2 [Carassius carassius]